MYSVIHDHVRIKKAATENGGTCQARSELQEESDDIHNGWPASLTLYGEKESGLQATGDPVVLDQGKGT